MKNPERIRAAAQDPRFRSAIEAATHEGSARNRLCGDELTFALALRDEVVTAVSARVEGCLVTSAAWTITAEALTGMTRFEALQSLAQFLSFLDGAGNEIPAPFTELSAFRRPSPRRECARLAALAIQNTLLEQNATRRECLFSAEVSPSPAR